MIVTTTGNVGGQSVTEYIGVVTGEAPISASMVRDIVTSIRDTIGSRIVAGDYERRRYGPLESELRRGRQFALAELEREARQQGADAVVGVCVDYKTVAGAGTVVVTASGTAVRLRDAA